MKRLGITIVAAFASAAFLLSGCSAITNKGGATTCKEFNTQDDEKQRSAVAAMLKEKDGKEVSNLEVTATRLLVQGFCKTLGKDSSKISEVNPR